MEIITLNHNRPDFIELQLNSLKKHLTDFNYTVFDSSQGDLIAKECEQLGVECIPIVGDRRFDEPSCKVASLLTEMWKLVPRQGLVVYLDYDMFLMNQLPDMTGYDWAFVPQLRPLITYPWTGLMMFNMDTLHPEDMNWRVASELGGDVGGFNHFYLKKHHPKVLELEMWTLVDDEEYSFNGAHTGVFHKNYAKMRQLVKDFPHPYSVDVFKTKDQPFDDYFIFHYKSASNYPPFATPEYNKLKTEALIKLL